MKPAVAQFYWSQISNAERVLDVGCATGDLGRYKPPSSQVFGLEVNPALVRQANQSGSVQVWDLDSPDPLPFPDGYFDAVVAKDILEHLAQPWRILTELKRILKPGGLVVASVICHRGRRVWDDYTHVRGFTMRSIRQMFSDTGFQVVDVWRMGGVPFTARWKLIWLVPHLLRFPPFDWLWTSSYELKARNPLGTLRVGRGSHPLAR